MDVFNPTIAPSQSGTSKATTAAVNTAQFGDGYSQRARDGINSISRSLSLSWESLTFAQATQLDDFFSEHAGDQSFLYQLPGDAVQRTWVCSSWKNGYEWGLGGSFSATLQEVFDIVP